MYRCNYDAHVYVCVQILFVSISTCTHVYVYAIVHVQREIEEKRKDPKPPLDHKKRTSKKKIPHSKVGVALSPSCKGHLTLNW